MNRQPQVRPEMYLKDDETNPDGAWTAGVVIGINGHIWPFIFGPDEWCPGDWDARIPSHEMTGPLPSLFVHRLRRRYCGAPTKTGTPCRNVAGYCRHHRKDTAS
jgi:hypothetical protein